MNTIQSAIIIKNLCKAKGHSISAMLAECNIRKSLIYDMEKRACVPAADVLESIANYLNCSVDYLLGRTDNPEINKMPVFDNLPMQEDYKIAAFGGDNEEEQPPIEEITT